MNASGDILVLAGWAAAATAVLAGFAEWLHARRCLRLGRLAFGPETRPRAWTMLVPPVRVTALAAMVWALIALVAFEGGSRTTERNVAATHHLLVLLDVSPSMGLEDAGNSGSDRRSARAAEVLKSVMERVPSDRVKITMGCFYSDSLLLVKDCTDPELVWNFANGLPLHMAYRPGKTDLVKSLNTAAGFVKDLPRKSTTALVLTDGDTLPDSGLKPLPSSITELIVVGIGDASRGTFIDGHLSRQDGASLSQLARRLGGRYHDGNLKQVPSELLRRLNATDERSERFHFSIRMIAVLTLGISAAVLCLLPLLLETLGSRWKAAHKRASGKAPLHPGQEVPA